MSEGVPEPPVTKTPAPVGSDELVSADPHSLQELTNLIQTLLQQTQDRFQTMSDQIIKRIDDMGKRIDDLETNINELMTQVGMENQTNQ